VRKCGLAGWEPDTLAMVLAEQVGIVLRQQNVEKHHPYRDISLICAKMRGTLLRILFLSELVLRNPL